MKTKMLKSLGMFMPEKKLSNTLNNGCCCCC